MTRSTTALRDSIRELKETIAGRVIEPGDPEYDKARVVMVGDIGRRPAAIVRVAGVADIQSVIALAGATGTELAIRSGGHSSKGDGTTAGGIVVDLHDMRAIEIDPVARTAWAETGLTAIEVTKAASEHGLAIGFGDTGTVGIGGITTGGGIGYLVRKHGLTIDNVLAADVVTADGRLLRADAETNADLFWAIRGGGGNFGVVARFQYRLVDLPGIVGGILILPATAETIERFVALADEAPEELSSIANVMPCPPMPFVDAAWHGKLVIFAHMCYAGPAEPGQQVIQPFRDLAKLGGLDAPLADLVKAQTYPEMFPAEESEGSEGSEESADGEDGESRWLSATGNLLTDRVDRPMAETMMRYLPSSDAPMRMAQVRVMGGAMARVPWDATAFAHRRYKVLILVVTFSQDEADREGMQAWKEEFDAALRTAAGATTRCAYVNFVGDEGEARLHDIYPDATWQRLTEIKRRYDPGNLFRLNQNIPPA